jgi:[ribosomal protein S5]-alanine N-acetyltransferase
VDLASARLVLRPITQDHIRAVLDERRLPAWADDFPSDGDRVIAGVLERSGIPEPAERAYGHRLVIERSSGLVVGGVGFFGPPLDGVVEIGYGIVESRRRRGYASEAVDGMVGAILDAGVVDTVCARGVDLSNPASVRVLEKCGFVASGHDDERATYVLRRSNSRPS